MVCLRGHQTRLADDFWTRDVHPALRQVAKKLNRSWICQTKIDRGYEMLFSLLPLLLSYRAGDALHKSFAPAPSGVGDGPPNSHHRPACDFIKRKEHLARAMTVLDKD